MNIPTGSAARLFAYLTSRDNNMTNKIRLAAILILLRFHPSVPRPL